MSLRWLMAPLRTALVALAAAGLGGPALAAEEGTVPPSQDWSFSGLFGSYDPAAAQRGLQVYLEVCSTCHSMGLVDFRHLEDLGYIGEQVQALASRYQIEDGPDDQGNMFMRPRRSEDSLPEPFPNDEAARAANGGALPPDLSVITKARGHGADYIYAFLTGFEEPPADVELRPGMSYNAFFPGHQVAMPNILTDGGVQYARGPEATAEQQARDVTTFLTWAAEPHMEERKATGLKVLLFLIVFAGFLYASKRKVWAKLH